MPKSLMDQCFGIIVENRETTGSPNQQALSAANHAAQRSKRH
jgi:hypothetical protein